MIDSQTASVKAKPSRWSDETVGLGRLLATKYLRGFITPALLPGEGRDSFVAMVIEEHRRLKPPIKPRIKANWKIDDYLRMASDPAATIGEALDFIRSLRRA